MTLSKQDIIDCFVEAVEETIRDIEGGKFDGDIDELNENLEGFEEWMDTLSPFRKKE